MVKESFDIDPTLPLQLIKAWHNADGLLDLRSTDIQIERRSCIMLQIRYPIFKSIKFPTSPTRRNGPHNPNSASLPTVACYPSPLRDALSTTLLAILTLPRWFHATSAHGNFVARSQPQKSHWRRDEALQPRDAGVPAILRLRLLMCAKPTLSPVASSHPMHLDGPKTPSSTAPTTSTTTIPCTPLA